MNDNELELELIPVIEKKDKLSELQEIYNKMNETCNALLLRIRNRRNKILK